MAGAAVPLKRKDMRQMCFVRVLLRGMLSTVLGSTGTLLTVLLLLTTNSAVATRVVEDQLNITNAGSPAAEQSSLRRNLVKNAHDNVHPGVALYPCAYYNGACLNSGCRWHDVTLWVGMECSNNAGKLFKVDGEEHDTGDGSEYNTRIRAARNDDYEIRALCAGDGYKKHSVTLWLSVIDSRGTVTRQYKHKYEKRTRQALAINLDVFVVGECSK